MRKIFALTVVTLLGSTAFAAGEVYRWKDPNGIWHYSDQPQPGAELVRGARLTAPNSNSATPAPAPAPAPAAAPANVSDASLPISNEAAQQVRKEAADAKAQQCDKAKAAYDQAVQARRIFKTDETGKQVFLSEAEIDAARLQARSNRDLACGP
jgi:predicted lipid-binding transport protein (Tim44 family)